MRQLVALLIALISVGTATAQERITSPEKAFGFKLGTDRKLADWTEPTAYYKNLASESARVRYRGQSEVTYKLFYNALLYSSSRLCLLREHPHVVMYRQPSQPDNKGTIDSRRRRIVVHCFEIV
jgi:hypothetical protein